MAAIKFELVKDLEALVLQDDSTLKRVGTIKKEDNIFLKNEIFDNLLILEVDNPRERRRVYAIQKDWIFQNSNVFEIEHGKTKEIKWFDEVDKMEKFKVVVNGVIAMRFDFIKWLNYSDNLDKYINTLADSLADIDYKNALGSDLEDVIYEIKIARRSNNFKEKIDLVSDFQENLLNLEIMERLTDCYYNNYYLITLNNEAIQAAREAD